MHINKLQGLVSKLGLTPHLEEINLKLAYIEIPK